MSLLETQGQAATYLKWAVLWPILPWVEELNLSQATFLGLEGVSSGRVMHQGQAFSVLQVTATSS